MSTNVNTVTAPESVHSPEINAILAALMTIGEDFNRSKIASAALTFERNHALSALALQICDLDGSDYETITNVVDTIRATKGHALKAFCTTLNKAITKITEGRIVLRAVSR